MAPKNFFLDSINFLQKKIGDIPFSNIPPTNTTSSSSTIRTTSTTIILITNMRSTDLHPCIYATLWLFQIRTAESGTEAESICLFRTSLSFRVQRNIVPLWVFKFCHNLIFLDIWHNLSFLVLSQFEFSSFVTIWFF